MFEIMKAIIFGIVEGITEWLPVSSTGHLILLEEFIPLEVSEEFMKMFDVVIQLGAILAVVVLFWSKIWPFGKKKNRAPLSKNGIGAWIKKDIFVLWFHIIVSCIPAVIVGLLVDDWVDEHFYNYICVAIMLIVVGIVFIIVETLHKGKRDRVNATNAITYQTALYIGLFQVIAAVLPGTSRSGATIIGALILGVSRTVAAEYTFYLAIPVMFGASLLKGFKFVKSGIGMTSTELWILVVGCVVAFVISLIVIKFLMGYIKKHDFKVFGWYRIVLGIAVLLCGLFGVIGK